MKRLFVTAIVVFAATIAFACPRPTGHCIVDLGIESDFVGLVPMLRNHISGDYPVGIHTFVGYETPMKWTTIGIHYDYMGSSKKVHSVGVEYDLNVIPLWDCTPVNVHIPFQLGYRHQDDTFEHSGYASTGLELDFGYATSLVQFFIRDDIGINFVPDYYKFYNYTSLGFRLWLGKSW